MNIFDTHAHYDDEAFDDDREELLSALPKNGVNYVINQGTDVSTSRFSVSLAEKYPYIYAAVGIHPQEIYKEENINDIKEIAAHPKVVAIGEIGLDYYYDSSNKETQLRYFKDQLALANELDLPVVIHDREAHKDTLDILKSITVKNTGVIHCFSGSLEMAKELLKLGYYLGFDGPITFKNARNSIEILEYIPLDKILIETDSPYLTPIPFRGLRNNSMYLTYVINKIAEIKGVPVDDISNITTNNAKTLFKIS